MISIVDDDPLVREATVDLVQSLGYETTSFDSAEKFLDSGQMKNTSCLIIDQQLPGLSGTELQRLLRAEGYLMPIIFITAFPETKVRDVALGAGATAYFSKPFEQTAFVDSLETALKTAA